LNSGESFASITLEISDGTTTSTACQTICSNSAWCVGYSYKSENKECNLYWLWTEGNRRVVDIAVIEGYDFKDVECSVGSELRKIYIFKPSELKLSRIFSFP
jgi:hypothetical protein